MGRKYRWARWFSGTRLAAMFVMVGYAFSPDHRGVRRDEFQSHGDEGVDGRGKLRSSFRVGASLFLPIKMGNKSQGGVNLSSEQDWFI